MAIDQEEELIVTAGQAAKRLLEDADFQLYASGVREQIQNYTRDALLPGSTEYVKGAVFGLALALSTMPDTVLAMQQILDREAAREDAEEKIRATGGPMVDDDAAKERVP